MKMQCIGYAAALAALLLLAVSCGDTSNTTPVGECGGATEDIGTAAEAQTAEKLSVESVGLPVTDFGGKPFAILSGHDMAAIYAIVDADETSGEGINDAVFARNNKIEELYNTEISAVYDSGGVTSIRNVIMSGDTTYSAVYNLMYATFTLGLEGVFQNFYDLPHINVEASWWDQPLVRDLTVDNRLYVLTGDISPFMNNKAFVIIFNKDMCNTLGLDMPYQAVLDGKWTQALLKQYIADINYDLNGDGKMDWDDRWGFVSEQANSYIMYVSSGGRVTEKNADGKWEIAFDTDKNITLAQNSLEITCDQTTTLIAEPFVAKHSWTELSSWYAAGGALMRSTALSPIPSDFRTLDVNFGVIPYPKIDESQKDYITLVGDGAVFAVPVTADPEFSGLILEAMAIESVEGLTPAFYDLCLEGKTLRDVESKEMLDIVFASKTFDVGLANSNIGFLNKMNSLASSGKTDAASAFTSIKKQAVSAIDKMYEQLAEIET